METDEPANIVLSNFKARHNSSAFLCRYRNCARAAQGFHTSELREKHEESHRPRFQCTHGPCGFFGTTFHTRAAMKKHAARYHDEEDTTSIPNLLVRKRRHLHDDRPLFTFTDKKSRVQNFGPRENLEMATNIDSSNIQTTITGLINPHTALMEDPRESAVPFLDRTISDGFQDELYRTGSLQRAFDSYPQSQDCSISARKPPISAYVQDENTNLLTTTSKIPVADISGQVSPFRKGSRYVWESRQQAQIQRQPPPIRAMEQQLKTLNEQRVSNTSPTLPPYQRQPQFTPQEQRMFLPLAEQIEQNVPPEQIEKPQDFEMTTLADQRQEMEQQGIKPADAFFPSEAVMEFPRDNAKGQQIPSPPTQPHHDPSVDQFLGQQQDALRDQEAGQLVVPAVQGAPPGVRGTLHPGQFMPSPIKKVSLGEYFSRRKGSQPATEMQASNSPTM